MKNFNLQLFICSLFILNVIYVLNYYFNLYKLNLKTKQKIKNNFKLPFNLSTDNEIVKWTHDSNLNLELCSSSVYRCIDSNCDCSKICQNDQFELVNIADSEIIYNGQQLSSGYYCMLKNKKNKCLANVSIAVFQDGKWHCLCKFPHIFSGPYCSDFIACKVNYQSNVNLLWDYKLNEVVDLRNLKINFYEYLPASTTFRYRCLCEGLDRMGNQMISFDFSPFECFVDPCKNNIPFSSVSGLDKTKMECDCGDFQQTRQKNVIENNKLYPCTPCHSSFKRNQLRFASSCFNELSNVVDYEVKFYPCVNYKEHVTTCNVTKLEFSANYLFTDEEFDVSHN